MSIIRKKLENAVLEIIKSHADGISEFDLIQILQKDTKNTGISDAVFKNNLSLFNCHFILFHLLYKIRDRLWDESSAHLEISALKIILLPYTKRETGSITLEDPLREYYLDLNNLENATEQGVDTLLNSFWELFTLSDQRTDALKVLGLTNPVDYETIKKQYRRLAMEHHPDRGGNVEKLQSINVAMEILAKYHLKQ